MKHIDCSYSTSCWRWRAGLNCSRGRTRLPMSGAASAPTVKPRAASADQGKKVRAPLAPGAVHIGVWNGSRMCIGKAPAARHWRTHSQSRTFRTTQLSTLPSRARHAGRASTVQRGPVQPYSQRLHAWSFLIVPAFLTQAHAEPFAMPGLATLRASARSRARTDSTARCNMRAPSWRGLRPGAIYFRSDRQPPPSR